MLLSHHKLSTSGCTRGRQCHGAASLSVGSGPQPRLHTHHAAVVAAPGTLPSSSRTQPVGAAPPSVSGQAGAAGTPPPRAARKKSKKNVEINGEVSKDLGNGMFNIKLENGVTVMAHLSGKIRQNRIKIVGGDKVTVELSPYDLTKGRITYRFRPGEYESLQAQAQQA